jgi:hypothetical protein
MKRLFIILLFASCWDGEINGRKYKLETPCIESHIETHTILMSNGKYMYPVATTSTVCDCYGATDTIWQKPKNTLE